MNQSFDTPLESNEADATYKALRDSVMNVYQFATKIAKESNPDNELRVGWDLGDKSLINWISDTHCYLIRKGQKIQFLARPSKLEIISFSLAEGDRLLICSDNLRNVLTETNVDTLVQESSTADAAVTSLVKAYSTAITPASTENIGNIIVMEVINNRRNTTVEGRVQNTDSRWNPQNGDTNFTLKKAVFWVGLPVLSLLIGAGLYTLYDKTDKFQGLFSGGINPNIEDTLAFLGKDTAVVGALDVATRRRQDSLAAMAVLAQVKKEEAQTKNSNSLTNNEKQTVNTTVVPVEKTDRKSSTKKITEEKKMESTPSESNTSVEKPKNLTRSEVEKQNYEALLLQRDKWSAIVEEFKVEQANGNNTVAEKLIKAQQVLSRINQKINESSKRLGY